MSGPGREDDDDFGFEPDIGGSSADNFGFMPDPVDPELERSRQAADEWAATPDPVTGGRRSRELHMPTFNLRAGSPEVTTTGEAREVVVARPGEVLPGPREIVPVFSGRGAPVTVTDTATGQTATGGPISSGMRSAATGVVQGLTFGFGDELAGAAGAAFDRLRGEENPGSYEDWRDAARRQSSAGRRENPGTYLAGNVVGAAAPAVITAGAGAVPAAASGAPTLAGAIGRGAAMGLAGGTAAGIGESEAEDVVGVAEDAVRGGSIGALSGGVLGAVGHGVGRAVDGMRSSWPSISRNLSRRRSLLISRQMGVQTPTQLRTIDALPPSRLALADAAEQGIDPRTLERGSAAFGADVERLGLTGARRMATPQDAAQLAEPVRARATQVMDDIAEAMRNAARSPASYRQPGRAAGVVDGSEVAARLRQAAADVGRARNQSSTRAAMALRATAKRYEAGGDIPFDDALQTMRSLSQDIQAVRTNPLGARTPFFERVAEVERAALNTATDRSVTRSLGRDAARTYQAARRDFQVADSVTRLVRDLDNKEAIRRQLSLTDNIAMAATAVATGNPVAAVGGGFINRWYRPREAALFSEGLRRMLELNPERFGRFAVPLAEAARRGGGSLAARYYVMSQQFPEFRQLADELELEREASSSE